MIKIHAWVFSGHGVDLGCQLSKLLSFNRDNRSPVKSIQSEDLMFFNYVLQHEFPLETYRVPQGCQ